MILNCYQQIVIFLNKLLVDTQIYIRHFNDINANARGSRS